MLGGLTTASFTNATITPGSYVNSNSFSLPAGTYLFTIRPSFELGSTSSATFSNIFYIISTAINGGGTTYFSLNETNLKIVESNGNGGTYASIYSIGILTLTTAQATLYASVQFNYAVGGNNANAIIGTSPGGASFYRIA